jgi:hypothetical protein
MATIELAIADDAFRLRPDVDEDLVLVDPDDGALDDVAVLEALDVRVLLGEELLHRRRLGAEVADRRLFLLGLVTRGGGVGDVGRIDGCVIDPVPASAAGAASATGASATVSAGAASAVGASASASVTGAASAAGVSASGATAAEAWVVSRVSSVATTDVSSADSAAGWVAGSSATATAATVDADAWVSSEAIASVSGVVPPCLSSVKCCVSPVHTSSPETPMAWAAPRPVSVTTR